MNVDFVIEYLKQHGRYTPSREPLHILDVDFHFDGVLIGPDNHNGLVLVHGTNQSSGNSLLARIRSFSLALERSESMRVVTLILVGQFPDKQTFSELNRICRVLIVPNESSLEDSLVSLLPLVLPEPISASDTAAVALRAELADSLSDPIVSRLIKAAHESEDEVQKVMRKIVEEITER